MESSKDEYLPREIKLLVIHCSATRCNVSFPVERLRECHLQRGFRDIGYHFYITRDGVLHHCRPVSEIGAHVRGFNRHSIGICYEGGLDENGRPADTRTTAQRFAGHDWENETETILFTGLDSRGRSVWGKRIK